MAIYHYYDGQNWVGLADVNHTHPISIDTSTATRDVLLAFSGKYALTAGGSSVVFQMPASPTFHTYEHNVVISDSSNSYKFCFTVYTASNTALTFQNAFSALFGALTAWKKTSIPFTVVTSEWTSAIHYPRATLADVTYTGSSVLTRKYTLTIRPTEGAFTYNQSTMFLSLFTSDVVVNEENCTVEDTVKQL